MSTTTKEKSCSCYLHCRELYMMGESMENQEIDEKSYNGSYKATKKNDSSHQ
jgi:hypothetical protein